MDSANDNPLKRFSSFWLGLLLTAAFGILCLLAAPWFVSAPGVAYEEAMGERRAKIRAEVEEGQSGDGPSPASTFEKVGGELLKPAAPVVDPVRVLPGSAAAEALQSAPTEEVELPEVAADAPVDPAVMKVGEQQYLTCLGCHGPDGNGMPNVGPPLAESEWVNGPVENLIRIQLRGLTGPITVKGTEYTFAAPMVPQAHQTRVGSETMIS